MTERRLDQFLGEPLGDATRGQSTGTAAAKARIAEAVHQAVCQVTGSDGFGHCALYASVGAAVMSAATGAEYVVNAGRLEVGTGARDPEDGDAETYLGMDPALSGYSGREFHAWILRRPPGMAVGTVFQADPGSVEVADLSMRHYRAMAEGIGLTWQREALPPWYWGPLASLREMRVNLYADAEMTAMLLREQPFGPVEVAAWLAVRLLARPYKRTALCLLSATCSPDDRERLSALAHARGVQNLAEAARPAPAALTPPSRATMSDTAEQPDIGELATADLDRADEPSQPLD